MDMSSRASEDVAAQATRNIDAMMQCGSVMADGFQAMIREMMTFGQDVMQRNIDGMNTMMRVRTLQDLVSVQSELVRNEWDVFMTHGMRMSELAGKMANRTAQTMAGVAPR